MQDFEPAHCHNSGGAASNYPAYVFYASARDLARFGLLYLNHGAWKQRQIVPAAWIDESTKPYSTTDGDSGYGYLWWTVFPDRPAPSMHLPAGSYYANGNGGQIVFVIPSDDLVVVHLARMGSGRAHPNGVGRHQVGALLGMVLAAESERR